MSEKAALAEQQQDDHADDEPMPEAETTHQKSPISCVRAEKAGLA
jgi:hypothetical protein